MHEMHVHTNAQTQHNTLTQDRASSQRASKCNALQYKYPHTDTRKSTATHYRTSFTMPRHAKHTFPQLTASYINTTSTQYHLISQPNHTFQFPYILRPASHHEIQCHTMPGTHYHTSSQHETSRQSRNPISRQSTRSSIHTYNHNNHAIPLLIAAHAHIAIQCAWARTVSWVCAQPIGTHWNYKCGIRIARISAQSVVWVRDWRDHTHFLWERFNTCVCVHNRMCSGATSIGTFIYRNAFEQSASTYEPFRGCVRDRCRAHWIGAWGMNVANALEQSFWWVRDRRVYTKCSWTMLNCCACAQKRAWTKELSICTFIQTEIRLNSRRLSVNPFVGASATD